MRATHWSLQIQFNGGCDDGWRTEPYINGVLAGFRHGRRQQLASNVCARSEVRHGRSGENVGRSGGVHARIVSARVGVIECTWEKDDGAYPFASGQRGFACRMDRTRIRLGSRASRLGGVR